MKSSLTRTLITMLLATPLGLAPFPIMAQTENGDIYGTWKIKKEVTPVGSITGMNDQDVRRLMRKPVVISAERFTYHGRTCVRPSYQRTVEDTASYLYEGWRVNSDEMPLADRITVIETECGDIYLARKGHIILADDGVFLEAVRVKK
jgi:hypothetical protein